MSTKARNKPAGSPCTKITEETICPCGESDAVEALLVGVEEDVVVGAHLELEVALEMRAEYFFIEVGCYSDNGVL